MADPLVTYEVHGAVATLTLARPEKRNAQNLQLLYDLNAGFDRAATDGDVKVLVLQADGPDFSSGHDLRDICDIEDFAHVGTWKGFDKPGAEGYFSREQEIYLTLCQRWRTFPKPTIAAVQGRTIAGGLMLVWVCDLIIATEEATFTDPTVALGVNGVELFAHSWELGPRKAKEMLFTGDAIDARTAERLGMVNHVVPADQLRPFTHDLARRISEKPSFALKLAKMCVNQDQEHRGYSNALNSAMSAHHLAHTHNLVMFGERMDPSGFPRAVTRDGA